MKGYLLFFLVALSPLLLLGQPGMIENTCSDDVPSLNVPDSDTTCQGFSNGNTYTYPDDFTYLNDVTWYQCLDSDVRIVVSNNVPDHDVSLGNPNDMCEVPYWISLPLNPELASDVTEPSNLGIIAIALNGVSVYGAQEGGGTNAVEPGEDAEIQDAQYWFGHAEPEHRWHYHNPQLGYESFPDEDTLMAYSMDGFPIYGPVSDDGDLDECNGRTVDGSYRYHVQTLDQVDGDDDYCDGDNPAIQWGYVISCWSGSVDDTVVESSGDIPSDCVAYDPSDVSDEDGDDDEGDDEESDSESDSGDGDDDEGDSESESGDGDDDEGDDDDIENESGDDGDEDDDEDVDEEDNNDSGSGKLSLSLGYLFLVCVVLFVR